MDNNQEHNQSNVSPVAAGITGFILGIVGTAAIAMSDKDTRTKVTKKANEMKSKMDEWSKNTLHDLEAKGDEIKAKTAADKMDEQNAPGANAAEEAKQRLEDALSEDKKEL